MVGCVWVWGGISCPFTVLWAKAQGRGQVHLFLFSQIPRSLIMLLGVYLFGFTKFRRHTFLPLL